VGAVCMPVNWRLSAEEAGFILDNGGARLLITDAVFADTARRAAPAGLVRLLGIDDCQGLRRFDDWYLRASSCRTATCAPTPRKPARSSASTGRST